MNDRIQEKYRNAPHRPGVYLMKDARGKILYAGKAKDLKKRLAAYFVKKPHHDPKTAALLEMVKDFDFLITASDHEAVILESNLIKAHNPKYNVILKDGKNYPLLRIDMNDPYPAIQKVRKIRKDSALYFGPYSSTASVNRTLKQIQKIFRLRKCTDTQFRTRTRPCLNFQIKACSGPCCSGIPEQEYRKTVQDAVLFLKGRSGQVVKKLRAQMVAHADRQEFEKAAQIRDTVFAITNVMERQVVVSADLKDRDVMALAAEKGRAVVTVLMIRSGRLVDTAGYHLELGFKEPSEVLSAFADQYYRDNLVLPSFVLFSRDIDHRELLEKALTHKKGAKVTVTVPVRGEKKRLTDMAMVNAVRELEKRIQKEEEERAAVLMLRDLLKMDNMPERIECVDNSNLAGQDPVSGMAVFINGRPFKDGYRRFIIRDQAVQDDYAYMVQVLGRRFKKDAKEMPLPDLLVVDGGKGQLGMAMAVLRELGLDGAFTVAGLAKKNEAKGEIHDKIYLPGRANPLNTGPFLKALYLLQQVRDEAHRFAVTFQRRRREKRAGISILDGITGIGPRKKQMLLKHFKGVEKIRQASVEEIAGLPGMNRKLAHVLLASLSPPDEK